MHRLKIVKSVLSRVVLTLSLPVFILVFWEVGSLYGWFNAFLLPAPSKIWAAGFDLFIKGDLQEHLLVSLLQVLSGFAISAS